MPFTVTVGKLPELLFDARATILFGAMAALANAAEAAASAMAPFMVSRVSVVLVRISFVRQDSFRVDVEGCLEVETTERRSLRTSERQVLIS